MSAQTNRSRTADIVNMVSLLSPTNRRRSGRLANKARPATLLSIRQSLKYQASIGFDDINRLSTLYSKNDLNFFMKQVRSLLNKEFGYLRVHRFRQVYTVGHHCLEGLIAGLLRVQFHAKQLCLPGIDTQNKAKGATGIPLSWGVGKSVLEADNDRLKGQKKN